MKRGRLKDGAIGKVVRELGAGVWVHGLFQGMGEEDQAVVGEEGAWRLARGWNFGVGASGG